MRVMANVHIALVGGQTYPVYLGIAETSPDRVMLVHSRSSLDEAQRIAAEFKGTGIPFLFEPCDPVNVKQVLEKTRMLNKVLSDDDHYTINLTSGTKVWSILFHEAFGTKPHVKFIYVDQSCSIYDLSNGDCRLGAPIDTDRVFRLNDTSALDYLDYGDLTDDDMAALHTIKKLTRFNWTAFTALTVLRTDDMKQLLNQRQGAIEYKGSTLSWDRVANQATMSLERNDGRRLERELSAPHLFNMLLNAGWFEVEVARHLSRWKHSHEVRLNVMFPYVEGNAKNEIDVIVNTGNRLMFVECKTQIHTLTDLDKFSKAVRNYGGTGCHALFVTFGPMTSEASEKCRDNGIIPFSFKDALTASRETEQQDVITRALHKLLDDRLFTINKK